MTTATLKIRQRAQNGRRKFLKIPTDSYKSPLYACTIYFVVKRKGEELFRRVGDVTNYGRQWYNIKECRPIVLHCSWSCPLICEGSLACPRRRYYMNAHIISLAISPHFTLNLTTGMNRASKNMWDRVFNFFKSAKYYINWSGDLTSSFETVHLKLKLSSFSTWI